MKVFIQFLLTLFFGFSALFSDQAAQTPDQIWNMLMQGNSRFIDEEFLHPDRNLQRIQALAEGQNPLAVVLGCADSRVPPEVIFDVGLGTLFTVRVAGNIAVAGVIGSVEYAVLILKAPLIVVLGHSNCGAVQAALQYKPFPGDIELIAKAIENSLPTPPPTIDLNQAIALNVKATASNLMSQSSIIAQAVNNGTLKIVQAVYDLKTGQVLQLP